MKMFAIFFMCLAVAAADVVLDGPCPDLRPVANFDMSAFQGQWYQIKKLPVANEAAGECGAGEYTVVGDVLKVNHSHIIDGIQKTIWGVISRDHDAADSGKLTLSTVVADNVRISPYWVVSTDYKNYAINYSCKYFKKSDLHAVFLWVLSRTKTLNGGASTIVNNFLKDNARNFPENRFVESDISEDGCKFRKAHVYTVPFDQ